ncbi:MAG: hypothetical protein P8015_06770 [Acidihalobacter sp.]
MQAATLEKDYVDVPLVDATPENTAPYGLMIGDQVHKPGLSIPFYKGSVEEGENLDFVYNEHAVVRTARISRRSPEITWLERHVRMTQLFVGLGSVPFAMVLGKPNLESGAKVPELEEVMAFRIPPGHGIMIHLTMNSEEVVKALAEAKEPADMDTGDVYKIDIAKRTGKTLRVPF